MNPQSTSAQTAVHAHDETFHTEQVLTIAGGHFVHDTFSAFIAPLLPVLQDKLSTNYALAGSLTIFAQLPGLMNPFVGYLADKISLRYFIILAPGVTATLMSLMGLMPSYASLAFLLVIAGLSIAAFHAPAPAMIGRVSGNRTGTGMSIFMASGELGRTLGPLLVTAGVTWFGLEGLWKLMVLGWITSAVLYFRLRQVSASSRPTLDGKMIRELLPRAQKVFLVLIWLMLARQFLLVSLTTFLPLFMTDVKQADLWLSNSSLTILEGAGVAGALLSGTLSDRLGRRGMLGIVLALAPLFMLLFLFGPAGLTAVSLALLGFTVLAPTAVMLALVQDQFPTNRALANGSFLATNFLIRSLAVWVVGFAADRFGLSPVFLWSGVLAWLSVPAVWFLPTGRKI
ncbi:MAG: MFS transporter [Ardenticatenaceae bacterium]|nr:MFS transporter [Ardenticatenaceae bacterium]